MKKILIAVLCVTGISLSIVNTQAATTYFDLDETKVYLAGNFSNNIEAQSATLNQLLSMNGNSPGGGTTPGGANSGGNVPGGNTPTSPRGNNTDIDNPNRTSPGRNIPGGDNRDINNPDRTTPSGTNPRGNIPEMNNPNRPAPGGTNPGNIPSAY